MRMKKLLRVAAQHMRRAVRLPRSNWRSTQVWFFAALCASCTQRGVAPEPTQTKGVGDWVGVYSLNDSVPLFETPADVAPEAYWSSSQLVRITGEDGSRFEVYRVRDRTSGWVPKSNVFTIGDLSTVRFAGGRESDENLWLSSLQPPDQIGCDLEFSSQISGLRREGLRGFVVVMAVIDENGTPDPNSFEFLEASAPDILRAAFEVMQTCRYRPAYDGDRPVPAIVHQPFNWGR